MKLFNYQLGIMNSKSSSEIFDILTACMIIPPYFYSIVLTFCICSIFNLCFLREKIIIFNTHMYVLFIAW